MKKVFSFIVAVAFILVFFCSCSDKKEIYGKWLSSAETETELVLSEDGKASLEIDGLLLEGTYVIENNVITLFLTDYTGTEHTIAALFELTDDKLILTNSQGQSEVFNK